MLLDESRIMNKGADPTMEQRIHESIRDVNRERHIFLVVTTR